MGQIFQVGQYHSLTGNLSNSNTLIDPINSQNKKFLRLQFNKENALYLSIDVFNIGSKKIIDNNISDITKECRQLRSEQSQSIEQQNRSKRVLISLNFPNFRYLRLTNNNIEAEGAKNLSPDFTKLAKLELDYNNIRQPNKTYLKFIFKIDKLISCDLTIRIMEFLQLNDCSFQIPTQNFGFKKRKRKMPTVFLEGQYYYRYYLTSERKTEGFSKIQ